MESFEATAEIFTPRWGHNDTYRFFFSMDEVKISHSGRKCNAIWSDTSDIEWKGGGLGAIMRNDSIYPPGNIDNLIGYLWTAWRNGELQPDQVQVELEALANYINASTMAKPKTEFWRRTF